jgi:hypothetical protein
MQFREHVMNKPLKTLKALSTSSALATCIAFWAPTIANADVVGDWNETASNVIVAKGAQGAVYLAMVHVAIYDAVNAIDRRYTVFAVKPTSNPIGASKEAAAAAAAYRVLVTLWPDQKTLLDTALAASLAGIPDGLAETRGVTIGTEVADAWLAVRSDDGREANVPYVFQTGAGEYQRTPPAFPNPVTPWMARMKPFTLTSPAQFRAYGPPDLTSTRYARDLETVKSLGSATSAERFPEETESARFHTENPTTLWSRNLRALADSQHLSTAQSARLYALLFVTFGDSIISCWDSKYHYNFWRPITAIHAADTDENPATTADLTWAPLAVSPPHPEYPAAHGCATGAITEVMRRYFGTRYVTFTFTSTVPNTVPHTYYRTDDLLDEVLRARVFGGMHFPTSGAHGAHLGKEVGSWVYNRHFKPVKNGK